jgi:hypothetical protein
MQRQVRVAALSPQFVVDDSTVEQRRCEGIHAYIYPTVVPPTTTPGLGKYTVVDDTRG